MKSLLLKTFAQKYERIKRNGFFQCDNKVYAELFSQKKAQDIKMKNSGLV